MAVSAKAEPGLELAVNWKWRVAPSEGKEWGMPLPEELAPKTPGGAAVAERPDTYEVKKGDAVIKIARKFNMTAAQLMKFNELPNDRLQIGQVLRIPTMEEVLTIIPPPPPPPPVDPNKEAAAKKKEKLSVILEPIPGEIDEAQQELDNVRQQVLLDREMFSPGVIDGKSGPIFLKMCEIYQRSHSDAENPGLLKAKAEAEVPQPYTSYTLRVEDFKFIKAAVEEPGRKGKAAARKKSAKTTAAAAPRPPTIDELVAADFLGYTSAWEFVAERFHCDEEFLHRINPQLKGPPVPGTPFQVPDVPPFEIEKALDAPLRPAPDAKQPVTAAVVGLTRLEISRAGKLIAVMPLSSARPGLRGSGSWTVLDTIPQPRLATKREPREAPPASSAAPAPATAGSPAAPPAGAPPLPSEQFLAAGPNNPVGIAWLNLAKAGSTEPLPYGLHGTSIPSQMNTRQGIGGFRLTNWNLARAMRLMPPGTTLQWKGK